ncbi:hypothetical protein N0V88_000129 [Collariella sp. IMI 366227]|nr:hypothetical protein N0V88_000129 [Collariella sp. IMI 366227]
MSGMVLSTLCSICHTEAPKYRCPGCGARTCSLPCVQKHKARADCNGERNPRAYMPLSRLKTEAGIDHDFNFISSIERARRAAEKDIVEGRNLLSEKDLRPQNEDKLFQKVWHGDQMRHVPVPPSFQNYRSHGRQNDIPGFVDAFDKHVRRRLRHLDIETITMPKGMARQRENKTAFNRRTGTVNWQVEWLIYSPHNLDLPLPTQPDPTQPLRILHSYPLNTALATTLDWHLGQLNRQVRELNADNNSDSEPDTPHRKKRKTYHKHHHSPHPHSNSPQSPPPPPGSPPPPEGEVVSDGDEVMVGAGNLDVGAVVNIDGDVDEYVDSGSESTHTLNGEDGKILEEEGLKPRGGLVDYGSSDEEY